MPLSYVPELLLRDSLRARGGGLMKQHGPVLDVPGRFLTLPAGSVLVGII
jgi:hypothetical protein